MRKYKEFAWRGIFLKMPSEWNMTFESGGSKEGYFRVDDRYRPRLEVKWEMIPFERSPQPQKIVENLLNDLRKKVAKKRIKLELKVISLRELNINGHEGILYYLKGLEDSVLISWYCEKDEKAYILQIGFKPTEYNEMKKVIDNILASLRCHFDENYNPWILYGFWIKIPKNYILIGRKFTSGLSYLHFQKKQAHIVFGYSSMANILLEEYYSNIIEWYRHLFWKEIIKNIGKFKVEYESGKKTVINGHKAMEYSGSTSGFFKKFKLYIDIKVWRCDAKNRLYCFTTVHKGLDKPKEFTHVIKSIRCH